MPEAVVLPVARVPETIPLPHSGRGRAGVRQLPGVRVRKGRALESTTCTLIIFHEPEFFIFIDNECNVQVEESG